MKAFKWLIGGLAAVCAASAGAEGTNPFSVRPELAAGPDGPLLRVAWSVPAEHYLYADMLAVEPEPPASAELVSMPAPEIRYDEAIAGDREVYTAPFVSVHRVLDGPADAGRPLRVRFEYQGCKGEICYLPEQESWLLHANGRAERVAAVAGDPAARAGVAGWRVRARAEGYLGAPAFLEFLAGGTPVAGGSFWERWLAQGGVIGLLVILVGGLLLNLTPCVLPMIPVNLAIIGAGARAGSRLRGFALGLAYGLGMTAAYGLLGVVVVRTGAIFGTWNASPWVNAVFAALFVLLALAVFGVFNLDFSRFQPAGPVGARPRRGPAAFGLAIGMGALAAVLAGACVAPIVVAVLAHAASLYASNSGLALALPFALGAGMALPWPAAGAGLSVLPRPGRWMTAVKAVMGVVILALAVQYAWTAWEGFRFARGDAPTAAESLEAGLARAARAGKPVVLDFWATWCKSCKAMDETTLKDATVRAALADYEFVKVQAERPGEPATRAVLDRYGVRGLPTFVILDPP